MTATASREHLRKPRKRYRFPDRESAENAEEDARHSLMIAERFLNRVLISIHDPKEAREGISRHQIRTFKTAPIPGTNYVYALRVIPEDASGYQYFALTFLPPGQSPSTTIYTRAELTTFVAGIGWSDNEQRALRDLCYDALAFRFPGID